MIEYTADEIESAINAALKEQRVDVIPSLIAVLAVRDPARAERVRLLILAGLRIAGDLDGGSNE